MTAGHKRPSAAAVAKQVERISAICLALPEAAVTSGTGQHHAYSVRGKKFAYHINDHHGDDRVSFQCKADKGVNAELVAADPARFMLPPYMAQHGWIGVWLDLPGVKIDWDEIEALATDAYRLLAPKRLVALLD
jgi:hypothetical protein